MKKYICGVCGYIYDEAEGDPAHGVAAGTLWEAVPKDWVCPVCGADKGMFTLQEGPVSIGPWDQPAAPAVKAQAEGEKPQALQISARCSNLARGCTKQYLPDEAALFTQLADFFSAQAAAEGDAAALKAMQHEDLSSAYPEAFQAARQQGDRGALRALTWTEKVTAIQQTLLNRYESKGEEAFKDQNIYVCDACGFIFVGDEPPEICPVCKVPRFKFDLIGKGA